MAPSNAVARSERAALADLMLEVGPDSPTLCGTWTARDLAAHLVLRERRPEAAGLVISALRARMERVQAAIATRPFETLVDEVRQGPPFWNPTNLGPVDALTNTVEFFVHHEDVRRAAERWEPRSLDAATADAIWQVVPTTLRAITQRSPVGIDAAPSDGPAAGTTTTLKGGTPKVTLVGPVGEIVLAVYGRVTSGLEVVGDPPVVEAFRSFPR